MKIFAATPPSQGRLKCNLPTYLHGKKRGRGGKIRSGRRKIEREGKNTERAEQKNRALRGFLAQRDSQVARNWLGTKGGYLGLGVRIPKVRLGQCRETFGSPIVSCADFSDTQLVYLYIIWWWKPSYSYNYSKSLEHNASSCKVMVYTNIRIPSTIKTGMEQYCFPQLVSMFVIPNILSRRSIQIVKIIRL